MYLSFILYSYFLIVSKYPKKYSPSKSPYETIHKNLDTKALASKKISLDAMIFSSPSFSDPPKWCV